MPSKPWISVNLLSVKPDPQVIYPDVFCVSGLNYDIRKKQFEYKIKCQL